MSKTVNIHDAKTHFSKIIAEVEAGAEVLIARSGKVVAKLVPSEEVPIQRGIGFAAPGIFFPELTEAEWSQLKQQIAKDFSDEKPWQSR